MPDAAIVWLWCGYEEKSLYFGHNYGFGLQFSVKICWAFIQYLPRLNFFL